MKRWYLDTSAAMKLIKRESESTALTERLRADRPDLISALLLETELRRAGKNKRYIIIPSKAI